MYAYEPITEARPEARDEDDFLRRRIASLTDELRVAIAERASTTDLVPRLYMLRGEVMRRQPRRLPADERGCEGLV